MTCPPEHGHGENGTCYVTHKCRCQDCRTGRAEYEYYRARNRDKTALVDGTGTRRRLQALAALGWSARAIAERYGHSTDAVSTWVRAERINRATAKKVARWYDDLSMTLPPTRNKFERYSVGSTKGRAKRAGWFPPLAWDDETIDDPNVTPEQPPEPEPLPIGFARHERVIELHAARWSDPAIANELKVSVKTIGRDRAFLGLPAWAVHEHTNERRTA